MGADPTLEAKEAELAEAVRLIRERVRARHCPGGCAPLGVELPDLMPLVHARDAAVGKVAAIGTVNPRPAGALNNAIQILKRLLARSLGWLVRGQVDYNRAALAYMEAALEALEQQRQATAQLAAEAEHRLRALEEEHARGLQSVEQLLRSAEQRLHRESEELARNMESASREIQNRLAALGQEAAELKDIRTHWQQWRQEWERKLALNEMQFLRGLADLQGAFNHRATLMESNFREMVKGQHRDFEGALERATLEIQQRLWKDLERVRLEYERLIHTELRLIRQRVRQQPHASSDALVPADSPAPSATTDWLRFAERFRGTREHVLRNAGLYRAHFAECSSVLDAGCGRGEMLEAFREAGIPARGVDADAECVELCRQKGLDVAHADVFDYLASMPEGELDGLCAIQMVEHLPPLELPRLISLAARALRRGGKIAVETPNPACLAIFATHFFLDPTHTRPVPAPLLSYYLEESGFGSIQVVYLSPAEETLAGLNGLPQEFRREFFGGLDYVILAERL